MALVDGPAAGDVCKRARQFANAGFSVGTLGWKERQ